jgi:hypothetical protein
MAATNTQIVDYVLYDFNNKQGRVPFLDNQATRDLLNAQIRAATGL